MDHSDVEDSKMITIVAITLICVVWIIDMLFWWCELRKLRREIDHLRKRLNAAQDDLAGDDVPTAED